MRKIISVVALVLLALSAAASAEKFEPSPPFKGAAMPEPPMQRADWTAPKTELPDDLVSGITRLFQQGLADPRGCEYRSIAVGTGNCWSGDGGVVQCHGWVLPTGKMSDPRFAVCWNGLVYPVVSAGDKADPDADINTLIKADEEARSQYAKQNREIPFMRFGAQCAAEGTSVSEKALLPHKVCMVLRLDKSGLAAGLWKCWQGPDALRNGDGRRDPYLELSDALLWSAFDRTICAHMRGDDRLALLAARSLTSLRKSVEDEYAARKIKSNQPGQAKNSYLDVLPTLLTDQERRAKEPARTPALKLGEKSFASHAEWVAALIKDLDQVDARQMGQPGGVSLGEDPIVQALITSGDDAVDPLIDCLEHDTRLTRSVHFWRDFAPTRMPLSVNEAAYVALSGILRTSFFGTGSTGDDLTAHGEAGRKQVAGSIRAYWKKYKGLSLAERWYRILADDQAGPEEWEQAMGNITRPVDVSVSPSSMFGAGWVSVPNRKPGEVPKLSGESLRSKANPSVLDLATKRIDQIDQLDADSSQHFYQAARSSGMALACWEFDSQGSLPILRKQLQFCVALFKDNFARNYGDPMLPGIAHMAAAMARSGDHSGLKSYGDWMRNIPPDKIGARPREVLANLWTFSDDPAIAATTEWMFNDPASSWNPMLPKVITGWGQDDLLRSPLLGIKSFRDQMQRGLKDLNHYATVSIGKDGNAEMKYDSGSSGLSIPFGETHVAAPGTTMIIRTCDHYAMEISGVGGAPEIQYYWLQADRDAAVKACVEFLDRYAQNLAGYDRFKLEDNDVFDPVAHLTFEPLEHPATAAETNAFKAIFSMQGQGESRLYKLPGIPAKATWITLKKYHLDQQFFSTKTGESGVNHIYSQDCWVWQAEELNVKGTWERYFGVVGPHEVAKVPASEIEFPGGWEWYAFVHSIDLKATGPGGPPTDQLRPAPLKLGSPLLVHVVLRNRLGVAQPLPSEFAARLPNGSLALRPGVTVTVARMGDVGDERADVRTAAPEKLTATPTGLLTDDLLGRTKMVESTQTLDCGSFDLRDCVNITRPGRYSATLQFAKESSFGEGWSQDMQFDAIDAGK